MANVIKRDVNGIAIVTFITKISTTLISSEIQRLTDCNKIGYYLWFTVSKYGWQCDKQHWETFLHEGFNLKANAAYTGSSQSTHPLI